jgi:hypothetical protein
VVHHGRVLIGGLTASIVRGLGYNGPHSGLLTPVFSGSAVKNLKPLELSLEGSETVLFPEVLSFDFSEGLIKREITIAITINARPIVKSCIVF